MHVVIGCAQYCSEVYSYLYYIYAPLCHYKQWYVMRCLGHQPYKLHL